MGHFLKSSIYKAEISPHTEALLSTGSLLHLSLPNQKYIGTDFPATLCNESALLMFLFTQLLAS